MDVKHVYDPLLMQDVDLPAACYCIHTYRKCFGFLCTRRSIIIFTLRLSGLVNGVACLLPTGLLSRRNFQCIQETCGQGSRLFSCTYSSRFYTSMLRLWHNVQCRLWECDAGHKNLLACHCIIFLSV